MSTPNPSFRTVSVVSHSYRTKDSAIADEVTNSYVSSSAGVCPWHRHMTIGTVTPDFYQKISTGQELPINGYSVMYNRASGAPRISSAKALDGWTYVVYTSPGPAYYTFTPAILWPLLGLPNLATEVSNKVMMRLGKKASGVQVNLAQFFGERAQTANLLASTASRIFHAARALRRGRLGDFTQSLSLSGTEAKSAKSAWRRVEQTPPSKRLSSHWLEFVYGWRPLLSDVYDSAELIARKASEGSPETYGTLRASAFRNYEVSGAELEEITGGETHWVGASHKYSKRITASYVLESQTRQVLAQTGITNPLLLAWELLPYSFVVDWFVPVSTYLESLTAFDGFTLKSERSYLTVKETWKYAHDYSASGIAQPNNRPWSRSGGVDKESFRFSRSPLLSWPSYLVQVKSPIGGRPLERLATSLALLRVLFK